MGSFVIVQSQDFRAGQTLQFCADSTIPFAKNKDMKSDVDFAVYQRLELEGNHWLVSESEDEDRSQKML